MTLDEAIIHCEEVAEEQEKLCRVNDSFNISQPKWRECGKEHRQLAEWLKELKRLREQAPCEDAISRAETVQFLENHSNDFEDVKVRMAFKAASSLVNNPQNLPTVQPKYNTSEWCTDCGEYNKEKHCCPRFNSVIRKIVEEMKQSETAYWIPTKDKYWWECSNCGRVIYSQTGRLELHRFCDRCGRRMVEREQKSEE